MKTYYLIADHYDNIDNQFYDKFAKENNIILVVGSYRRWGEYGASPFSETANKLILYRMIEFCDGVLVDRSYKRKKLTKDLLNYAKSLGKEIRFANKQWKLRKEQVEYWAKHKCLKESEDNAEL